MGNKVKTRPKSAVACDGLVNLKELGDILELSLPTLRKLVKEPGFPIEKQGSPGVPYEFVAVQAAEWKVKKEKRLEAKRQAREAALTAFIRKGQCARRRANGR